MPHIEFTSTGERDFSQLKRKNAPVFKRIVTKLQTLPENPDQGKPLVGQFKGTRSLRVGDYRILYEVKKEVIVIYSIKHRRDVYH